jgi:hypothetical protein
MAVHPELALQPGHLHGDRDPDGAHPLVASAPIPGVTVSVILSA